MISLIFTSSAIYDKIHVPICFQEYLSSGSGGFFKNHKVFVVCTIYTYLPIKKFKKGCSSTVNCKTIAI